MTDALVHGTCHVERVDPETFFPLDENEPRVNGVPPAGVRRALDYCNRCPVVAECLAYAFEHDIRDGVWGGMTGVERVAAVRRSRERVNAARLARLRETRPAPRPTVRQWDRCSVCETRQLLRVDGMVVKHPRRARRPEAPCEGAGQPPLREQVSAGS